jgi:hypothetical protein
LTTIGGRNGRAAATRVEDVRTIGRRDQNDAFVRFEAVHFDEQLIERLLALVVPPPRPRRGDGRRRRSRR